MPTVVLLPIRSLSIVGLSNVCAWVPLAFAGHLLARHALAASPVMTAQRRCTALQPFHDGPSSWRSYPRLVANHQTLGRIARPGGVCTSNSGWTWLSCAELLDHKTHDIVPVRIRLRHFEAPRRWQYQVISDQTHNPPPFFHQIRSTENSYMLSRFSSFPRFSIAHRPFRLLAPQLTQVAAAARHPTSGWAMTGNPSNSQPQQEASIAAEALPARHVSSHPPGCFSTAERPGHTLRASRRPRCPMQVIAASSGIKGPGSFAAGHLALRAIRACDFSLYTELHHHRRAVGD